jgi:flagellar biogenesis protein FliO
MTEAFAVVFVLALLAVTVLLLRRHGLPRLAMKGSREIETIESLRLGPNHTLYLLRVGGQRLLVATHNSGCTLLGNAAGEEHKQ